VQNPDTTFSSGLIIDRIWAAATVALSTTSGEFSLYKEFLFVLTGFFEFTLFFSCPY
jgi:hypothetical protein